MSDATLSGSDSGMMPVCKINLDSNTAVIEEYNVKACSCRPTFFSRLDDGIKYYRVGILVTHSVCSMI